MAMYLPLSYSTMVNYINEDVLNHRDRSQGFTLIEMSVVLVIIGLIVGGVLVGRDLIRAAGVRAQITQIEKYNTAVNTFRAKYGALPGDISESAATQFGFFAHSGTGVGNADTLVETYVPGSGLGVPGSTFGTIAGQGFGETELFWSDLSSANMVEGNFSNFSSNVLAININLYLPEAKIGGGNFIYVYSDGVYNYFGLSVPSDPLSVRNYNAIYQGALNTIPGLSVAQANAMDRKIDDGLPFSGNVQDYYLSEPAHIDRAGQTTVSSPFLASPIGASPAVQGDCYDSTTASGVYAVSIDGGNDVVCALSFKMQ